MVRRRALMTDRERELIAGVGDETVADELRHQAVSRVRRKIHRELTTDVELLKAYHGELYRELQDVVCPDEQETVDS